MTERGADNAADITDHLLAAASNGDRDATRRVLTVIQPLVARYCRSRLPEHRADDAAQEVCLAVLANLPRYDHRGKFLGWVYRIAHNKITDGYRAAARVEPMASAIASGVSGIPAAGVSSGMVAIGSTRAAARYPSVILLWAMRYTQPRNLPRWS